MVYALVEAVEESEAIFIIACSRGVGKLVRADYDIFSFLSCEFLKAFSLFEMHSISFLIPL